ncbi:MAG: MopE-related protein, partial [Myxococcota bacterium]
DILSGHPELVQTDDVAPTLLSICPAVDRAAASGCSEGECTYTCNPGAVNANGNIFTDGCECTPTEDPTELCDNLDNDCDNAVDEDDALFCPGRERATAQACTEGQCIYTCNPGWVDRNNDLNNDPSDGCEVRCLQEPSDDLCDGIDNDCDGQIDERTASLEEGCNSTAPDNAQFGSCQLGGCLFVCNEGWQDVNQDLNPADGSPSPDGCETQCLAQTELCDGIDNNCDGELDAEDDDYIPVLCPLQVGVCQGAVRLCIDGAADPCTEATYTAQNDAYEPLETSCLDDLDNDCDGVSDGNDPDCGCALADALITIADLGSTVTHLQIALQSDVDRALVLWRESSGSIKWVIWDAEEPVESPEELTDTSDGNIALSTGSSSWGLVWRRGNNVQLQRITYQGGFDLNIPTFNNNLESVTSVQVASRPGSDQVAAVWDRQFIAGTSSDIRVGYTTVQEEPMVANFGAAGSGLPDIALNPIQPSEGWGGAVAWYSVGLLEDHIRWRIEGSPEEGEQALNLDDQEVPPTIAWNANGYLLAYRDLSTNGDPILRAVAIAADGDLQGLELLSDDLDNLTDHGNPNLNNIPSEGIVSAWVAHPIDNRAASVLVVRGIDDEGSVQDTTTLTPLENLSPVDIDISAERILLGFITDGAIRIALLDRDGGPICPDR